METTLLTYRIKQITIKLFFFSMQCQQKNEGKNLYIWTLLPIISCPYTCKTPSLEFHIPITPFKIFYTHPLDQWPMRKKYFSIYQNWRFSVQTVRLRANLQIHTFIQRVSKWFYIGVKRDQLFLWVTWHVHCIYTNTFLVRLGYIEKYFSIYQSLHKSWNNSWDMKGL